MRSVMLLLLMGACIAFLQPSFAQPKDRELTPDEQELTTAGMSTDTATLLDFFRQRARFDHDVESLTTLTRRLADSDAQTRVRASEALLLRGAVALPALRRVANDIADPETAQRARQCIHRIEGEGNPSLALAAVRLLALRKPPQTIETLLAYLPAAETETVIDEVVVNLAQLAYPAGKPDAALLAALESPVALTRASAARALASHDHREMWPRLRPLLQDSRLQVRLQVAFALVAAEDIEGVPVLIHLLSELGQDQRGQIEKVLQQLAGEWAPKPAPEGEDVVARRIRQDAWAAWWKHTESPVLLEEMRSRTLPQAEQARVQALIHKLGHDDFDERERALADLVALGHRAVPQLRDALHDADVERVRRVDLCLQQITSKPGKPLPSVAVRLLAMRRPEAGVEVLLGYLPFAEDETLVAEVHTALAALAMRDGQLAPALVTALQDEKAVRRAAAAEAIVAADGLRQCATVAKLLTDKDPTVRLRVGLALGRKAQREAVPVLIEALADEPSEWSWQAVDLLDLISQGKGPQLETTPDKVGRRKLRDTWFAWWQKEGPKVDLANLGKEIPQLGYTLLVEIDPTNNLGRVRELNRAGKQRWSVENLRFPVDAHVIGENRVLIAEYQGTQVSERDFHGKVLWKKDGLGGAVINCLPLKNGNVFIATNQEIMEVSRDGKTVWSRQMQGLSAASRSPDGVICCLTNDKCVRITQTGKELNSFDAGRGGGWTSGIDVLSRNRILIAQPNNNTVSEYDALTGKKLWQAACNNPTTASGLPGGHVLVASHQDQKVTELDRAGKTIWEFKSDWHIFRSRRR